MTDAPHHERPTETIADLLAVIGRAPLGDISPAQAAKVMRRIVANESLAARLDITAFNSAPS